MREVTLDVPLQKAITHDNVAVAAKATIKFKVIDPLAAATKVLDIVEATAKVSNESLRNLLTQSEHEQIYNPGSAGNILQKYIDKEIENWGLVVTEAKLEYIHLGKAAGYNT
jgi:regulator of protease activity HflC (stomatin/prohibitin superfamily)